MVPAGGSGLPPRPPKVHLEPPAPTASQTHNSCLSKQLSRLEAVHLLAGQSLLQRLGLRSRTILIGAADVDAVVAARAAKPRVHVRAAGREGTVSKYLSWTGACLTV